MSKKDIIINFVMDNLNKGIYKPGRRIMSEMDMAEKFQIAKMTVREGLKILQEQGIIYKKPYSGSYICENINKPKYIIISANEATLIEDLRDFNIHLIDCLKEEIKALGYIPHLYLEKGQEGYPDYVEWKENDIANNITLNTEEVYGLILLGTNDENFKTYEKAGIPIVSMKSSTSTFPSIYLNYVKVYTILLDLFEKYNFEDTLIFHYRDNNFILEKQFLIEHGIYRYLCEKYNVIDVPLPNKLIEVTKLFENTMNKITKIPDCIVFSDNTIYSASVPLFSKYNHILKNTKIITLSNNEELFPSEYDICKLTFYIDEIAKKISDLLIKLIKKETPIRTNINIDCKVIDEEKLIN